MVMPPAWVLSSSSTSVPVPPFVRLPPPPMGPASCHTRPSPTESVPAPESVTARLLVNDPVTASVPPAMAMPAPAAPRLPSLETETVPVPIRSPPVKVLLPLSVSVPVPSCDTDPLPEIVSEKVTSSAWANASVPRFKTGPASVPETPPSPTCSVLPAPISKPPVVWLRPSSTSVPLPTCRTTPLPETVLEKLTVSARLNTKAPLSTMSPETHPLTPPSPTCSVPAAMVVPPA